MEVQYYCSCATSSKLGCAGGSQIVINTTQQFAAQSEETKITAETIWEIKLQQSEVLRGLNSQPPAVGSGSHVGKL